jgi:hypothetical protein
MFPVMTPPPVTVTVVPASAINVAADPSDTGACVAAFAAAALRQSNNSGSAGIPMNFFMTLTTFANPSY